MQKKLSDKMWVNAVNIGTDEIALLSDIAYIVLVKCAFFKNLVCPRSGYRSRVTLFYLVPGC